MTATRISFNRVGNPKGHNKELKQLLLDIIKDKQCHLEFDEWTGGGELLKSKLSEIERVAPKVEPVDVVTQYGRDNSSPSGLF